MVWLLNAHGVTEWFPDYGTDRSRNLNILNSTIRKGYQGWAQSVISALPESDSYWFFDGAPRFEYLWRQYLPKESQTDS